MPVTTNYGWITPTLGGDTGVWDTILNTAFDDIDADVKLIDDRVAALEAGIAGEDTALVMASEGLVYAYLFTQHTTNRFYMQWDEANDAAGAAVLRIPLRHLQTGYEVSGYSITTLNLLNVAGTTVRARLISVSNENGTTTKHAGHTNATTSSAFNKTSTTGISVLVGADEQWFIEVIIEGGTLVNNDILAVVSADYTFNPNP